MVQNTGTTKAEGCKDFGFDEENDITTIEVTVVTSSKEDAKAVAQTTRDAIRVSTHAPAWGATFALCHSLHYD